MAGFSNAATCALLLPLLIFSYHPTPAVSFSLNFPEFTTAERKDIKIEGDASFIGNASMGSIDMSANLYGSVSRASYNTQPVQLWDKAAGKVASFTTRFEFLMSSGSNDEVGMAFFLAGYPSSLPAGGTVHSLGLTDQNADSVASGDSRFVAVAFDTFNNPMASDPTASYDYDHIGIYVNSLRSVSTLKLQGSTLTSGTLILSVIEYDNVSNVLAVTLWDQDQQSYYLNSKVDLKSALPEQVSIGFSASTSSGECAAAAVVGKSWRRKSTTQTQKKTKASRCPGTGPRRFPYHELVEPTRNFAAEEKLGQGGFGAVYQGYLREPAGLAVAIKRLQSSIQGKKEYKSEVKVISRLRHRNLVQLIGWCHGHDQELLLVYELMPNRSLDIHLHGKQGTFLTWEMRMKILLELGSALLYLHEEWEQCVLHRDIKPSNVMLDESFGAKLGDFGLARLVDHAAGMQTMTAISGTPGYLDPDCVNTGKASAESDVYSFGVVLLEVACGRRPMSITPADQDKQKNGGVFRLVEWVWGLYGRGSILEAADERLNGDYDAAEVETVMVVGLWCAHPNPSVRPSIRTAMATLQPKVDQAYQLPVLPSKMPVPMYEPAPPLSWANVVGMSSSSSHTIGMSSSTSSSMPLHTSYDHDKHKITCSLNSLWCSTDGNNIKIEGDASFNVGWIDINANRHNGIEGSNGRAWYNAQPMLLWDKATGEVDSFTTRFTFAIVGDINNKGQGMAFFHTAQSSMPANCPSYILGLTDQSPGELASGDSRFVAVEFDTFNNTDVPDPDTSYDHIGIDVNSLVSMETLSLESFDLMDNLTAEIEYDGVSSILNMTVWLGDDKYGRPRGRIYWLSFEVDLKSALPEQVSVGFSASTSTSAEVHQLHSWSFNSSLEPQAPPPPPPPPPPPGRGPGKPMTEIAMRMGPRWFPYQELVEATRNFAADEKLGQGGVGAVYRGYLRGEPAGLGVAIKRFSNSKHEESSIQGEREYRSEIKVIRRLRHRNLVQLLGWCHDREELLLVYELMPNRSLDIHLRGKQGTFLTWPMRMKILLELGSALL
ncbi:hypothetical protein CFC21_020217 [Triticum aestivum]|uniref:non-specific serine/threonine protein kinase n=2 Tax=Triticum aestivum TaxID=4565 RepID=A0A3B6BA09_WHEAT|nr:hypothetical protein CFC21_020217 [Triticum aestivum]